MFDCLYYYERVHKSKNISINFTTEQLDTILNSGGSQVVIDAVSKEYELKNAEFIKAGAKVREYAKICDVVCKVANIAGAFKGVYSYCKTYMDSIKTLSSKV